MLVNFAPNINYLPFFFTFLGRPFMFLVSFAHFRQEILPPNPLEAKQALS